MIPKRVGAPTPYVNQTPLANAHPRRKMQLAKQAKTASMKELTGPQKLR
jgi:hypothetical protein